MDRTDLKHAEAPRNLVTNSLECSVSNFVCVLLIHFHVFMMNFC